MSVIVRLQNLPWSAVAADIRQFFNGLSIPDGGVNIVGGELGDAFITFSTDEDARLAMLRDGGKLKDTNVKLLLSSHTEMQKETARQQAIHIQYMQMHALLSARRMPAMQAQSLAMPSGMSMPIAGFPMSASLPNTATSTVPNLQASTLPMQNLQQQMYGQMMATKTDSYSQPTAVTPGTTPGMNLMGGPAMQFPSMTALGSFPMGSSVAPTLPTVGSMPTSMSAVSTPATCAPSSISQPTSISTTASSQASTQQTLQQQASLQTPFQTASPQISQAFPFQTATPQVTQAPAPQTSTPQITPTASMQPANLYMSQPTSSQTQTSQMSLHPNFQPSAHQASQPLGFQGVTSQQMTQVPSFQPGMLQMSQPPPFLAPNQQANQPPSFLAPNQQTSQPSPFQAQNQANQISPFQAPSQQVNQPPSFQAQNQQTNKPPPFQTPNQQANQPNQNFPFKATYTPSVTQASPFQNTTQSPGSQSTPKTGPPQLQSQPKKPDNRMSVNSRDEKSRRSRSSSGDSSSHSRSHSRDYRNKDRYYDKDRRRRRSRSRDRRRGRRDRSRSRERSSRDRRREHDRDDDTKWSKRKHLYQEYNNPNPLTKSSVEPVSKSAETSNSSDTNLITKPTNTAVTTQTTTTSTTTTMSAAAPAQLPPSKTSDSSDKSKDGKLDSNSKLQSNPPPTNRYLSNAQNNEPQQQNQQQIPLPMQNPPTPTGISNSTNDQSPSKSFTPNSSSLDQQFKRKQEDKPTHDEEGSRNQVSPSKRRAPNDNYSEDVSDKNRMANNRGPGRTSRFDNPFPNKIHGSEDRNEYQSNFKRESSNRFDSHYDGMKYTSTPEYPKPYRFDWPKPANCCVLLSNFPIFNGARDVLDFFHDVSPRMAIKFQGSVDDSHISSALIRFVSYSDKQQALKRNGFKLKKSVVIVTHVDDKVFEEANDDALRKKLRDKKQPREPIVFVPQNLHNYSCLVLEGENRVNPVYNSKLVYHDKIRFVFNQYKPVEMFMFSCNGNSQAFVRFDNVSTAISARKSLEGFIVDGKRVRIMPCSDEQYAEFKAQAGDKGVYATNLRARELGNRREESSQDAGNNNRTNQNTTNEALRSDKNESGPLKDETVDTKNQMDKNQSPRMQTGMNQMPGTDNSAQKVDNDPRKIGDPRLNSSGSITSKDPRMSNNSRQSNQPDSNNSPNEVPATPQRTLLPNPPMEPSMDSKDGLPQLESDCILMQGLPRDIHYKDIVHFFNSINIQPLQIHVMVDNGIPIGDAFCEFKNNEEAVLAAKKNNCQLGMNFVHVRLVTRDDLNKAVGKDLMPDNQLPPPLNNGPNFNHNNLPPLMPMRDNQNMMLGSDPRPMMNNRPPYGGGEFNSRPFGSGMDSSRPYGMGGEEMGGRDSFPFRGGYHMGGRGGPPMMRGGRGGGFERGSMRGSMRGGRGRGGGPPHLLMNPDMSRHDTRAPSPSEGDLDDLLPDSNVEDFGRPGCVVAADNIPFRADVNDIIEFFPDYRLVPDSVIRRYDDNGQVTGDARIAFETPSDARRAVRKYHRCYMFGRSIGLHLVR